MKRIIIPILILILASSCMVHGLIPVQNKGKIQWTADSVYFGYDNLNGSNLRFKVIYTNTGTIFYNEVKNNASGIIKVSLPPGNFKANITDESYNNHLLASKEFRIGTIINTGFKATLITAFKGDLLPVALTILFAVGLGAVSLGKFAGLPIMAACVGILAKYEYTPTYPQYLLLLLTVAIASKYLYDFIKE